MWWKLCWTCSSEALRKLTDSVFISLGSLSRLVISWSNWGHWVERETLRLYGGEQGLRYMTVDPGCQPPAIRATSTQVPDARGKKWYQMTQPKKASCGAEMSCPQKPGPNSWPTESCEMIKRLWFWSTMVQVNYKRQQSRQKSRSNGLYPQTPTLCCHPSRPIPKH